MTICPACGEDIEAGADVCPACEESLGGDGSKTSPEDESGTVDEKRLTEDRELDVDNDKSDTEDDIPADPPGVSRRGMLTYSGGSALLTFGGLGAGWFAFIREPTGPEEDVVREYVAALDRSHFYTAQSLFHENAPDDAWSATELPTMDRAELTVERTEVVDRQSDVDISGVQELALVHIDITYRDSQRTELLELAFIVAKNENGEWRMWRDQ
jgi:hypothetical protein